MSSDSSRRQLSAKVRNFIALFAERFGGDPPWHAAIQPPDLSLTQLNGLSIAAVRFVQRHSPSRLPADNGDLPGRPE